MRAVVHHTYGPPEVLHIEEVARPELKDDEILVKIHATTVNRSDCGWRCAEPFITRYFTGLLRPKNTILGSELAGEVEAVGSSVTTFKVGDELFGLRTFGAHAEYIALPETARLAHKPAGLTFEEAASVPDGATLALTSLRRADLQPGQRIVVYGASGSIGTAAVQLAKHHFGAHVTAVCNTKNIELVRSLGADEVVDYTQEDFTKNGETYDVILDAVGKHSFRRCRGSLKSGGIYLTTDLGFMWHVPVLIVWTRWFGDKTATIAMPRYLPGDLGLIKELIESGKYRPVIDRTYPFEEVVEATKYVETGQKTGNVVLTLNGAAR